MTTQLTEPLRTEHQAFLPQLEAIDTAATTLDDCSADDAKTQLQGIVDFLNQEVLPHAQSEEEVLYPAVDEVLGAPGAMATMTAEHAEIVMRTERLAGTVEEVDEWWIDPQFRREVARQLAGLGAIIASHFRKEETVLFPVLDAGLDPTRAQALLSDMHHSHE